MWDCEQFLNADEDFLEDKVNEYRRELRENGNHSEEEHINGLGTIKGNFTLCPFAWYLGERKYVVLSNTYTIHWIRAEVFVFVWFVLRCEGQRLRETVSVVCNVYVLAVSINDTVRVNVSKRRISDKNGFYFVTNYTPESEEISTVLDGFAQPFIISRRFFQNAIIMVEQ